MHKALAATADPQRRLTIVNTLLSTLGETSDAVTRPASQLLAVRGAAGPGASAFEDVRPATPLSAAALLTNAHGEPSLGSELRAELDTATRSTCSARSSSGTDCVYSTRSSVA